MAETVNVDSGSPENVAHKLFMQSLALEKPKTVDDLLKQYAKCLVAVQSPRTFYDK